MSLSNYHTHTVYCDGASTPSEMVESALALGLSELGFSAHSPLPGEDWCLPTEKVTKYFDDISSLKESYKGRISIFVGIEQDFMSEKAELPFDYMIGSVHSVETPVGERFVDISAEGVSETVDRYFSGDVYTLCEAYYDRVGCVADKTNCDIIGHFDLVTKFTERGVYIDETHPRYLAAQDRALNKLFSSKAVFEVNTGAMARGYRSSPYPNIRVLQRIKEEGRPVVVSSDCHDASAIICAIADTKKMLTGFGLRTLGSMEEILKITKK